MVQYKRLAGVVVALVVVALMMVMGAAAEDKPPCDGAKALKALDTPLKAAQSALDKKDFTALSVALHTVSAAAGASSAECAGMKFDSKTLGLHPVIGPLTFEDGIYKATVTTKGYFIGDLQVVSGTCDAGFMGLFNLSSGEGNQGAQNLITTEGCQAAIKISNTSAAWTLTFEKIK